MLQQLRQAKCLALEEFVKESDLKLETIKKVYKRYQASLAASTLASTVASATRKEKASRVTYATFCGLFESYIEEGDPTAKRVFACFDKAQTGAIDLREFLLALAYFTGASKDECLKLAFVVFDEEGIGALGQDELVRMLRANHLAFSMQEMVRKVETILVQTAEKPTGGEGGGGAKSASYEELVAIDKKFPHLIFNSAQQPAAPH